MSKKWDDKVNFNLNKMALAGVKEIIMTVSERSSTKSNNCQGTEFDADKIIQSEKDTKVVDRWTDLMYSKDMEE